MFLLKRYKQTCSYIIAHGWEDSEIPFKWPWKTLVEVISLKDSEYCFPTQANSNQINFLTPHHFPPLTTTNKPSTKKFNQNNFWNLSNSHHLHYYYPVQLLLFLTWLTIIVTLLSPWFYFCPDPTHFSQDDNKSHFKTQMCSCLCLCVSPSLSLPSSPKKHHLRLLKSSYCFQNLPKDFTWPSEPTLLLLFVPLGPLVSCSLGPR